MKMLHKGKPVRTTVHQEECSVSGTKDYVCSYNENRFARDPTTITKVVKIS
ncbi:hypothetical protein WUBG_02872 [Wuchereria bancrofti]|uniref:Uncharacterized protein n=1 Tax=Wuchereria bancrofti TaxID=6293 RepID=J9F9I1_WUCBA|nr:hypothetical protein WUBG_02872 [Wuchereria bancrofti]